MGGLLQVFGLVCVVTEAALIAPAAGFIVGGIALTVLGLAVESVGKGR